MPFPAYVVFGLEIKIVVPCHTMARTVDRFALRAVLRFRLVPLIAGPGENNLYHGHTVVSVVLEWLEITGVR